GGAVGGDGLAPKALRRRPPVLVAAPPPAVNLPRSQTDRLSLRVHRKALCSDLDGVAPRRRPDEGGRAQRRAQLPRQVSRCVVCLRAAESGELGNGQEGGEKGVRGD